MKFTLTQPVLDLDTVALHIADLKNVLEKPALISVVADITERFSDFAPRCPTFTGKPPVAFASVQVSK